MLGEHAGDAGQQAVGRLVAGENDGTRHLAFTSGPFGVETHMAHVGPDGRVRSVEQVLDDTRFNSISRFLASETMEPSA